MHHFLLLDVLKSLDNLAKYHVGFSLQEVAASSLDETLQVTPITMFEDEIVVAESFGGGMQTNDIRRAHLLHDTDLVEEQLLSSPLELSPVDDFDGVDSFRLALLVTQMDRAILALA